MKYLIIASVFALSACGGKSEKPAVEVRQETQVKSDTIYSGTAMVMIDSARTLKPGFDIPLNDTIELDDGREVDFHLADGASITLKGPVSGKLGALLETDTRVERWAKMSTDVLNKSANQSHVLTVRSGSEEGEVWFPFAVPVPFSGNFCIPAEEPLTLYRPGKSTDSLNFELSDGNQAIPLKIAAGENVEATWPDALQSDGEFEFLNPAWFDTNIFHVIRLPELDKVTLAKEGCTYHLDKIKQLSK